MKSIKRLIALLLIVEGAIIVYCLTGQPTEEELADYDQARHDLVQMDNEIHKQRSLCRYSCFGAPAGRLGRAGGEQ